ncbi:MAG: hypothetical protein HY908_11635, partial [Myxococcales bacterium]|nr:hypothetical protein [Myxococcales bacterium]
PVRPSVEAYPWLADATLAVPPAVDTVVGRFAPPAGFERVPLETGSFGAWLRALPLAAAGTPVVSFDGTTLHAASDPRIAAVAALDVGKADLQQCADAIMRLWGEWSWARGVRDLRYRLANGQELPYARYQRGERVVSEGRSIRWEARAKATAPDDHRAFRAYLDQVFMFANTGSLAKQARPVGVDALRPGDFVIQPGAPGHAVLVLDLARAPDGRRAVLLGQSYMPAQSFQVLRPAAEDAADRGSAWFTLDPDGPGLTTPFWPTFAWSALRRLD